MSRTGLVQGEACPTCGRMWAGTQPRVDPELMEYILEHEPVHGTITDVCAAINRSSTGVNAAIRRLEEKGLISVHRKSRFHWILRSLVSQKQWEEMRDA